MVKKGLNSSIQKIISLKKNLWTAIEDSLDNLDNTQETIEQNIQNSKSNIYFKIMQNLSGDYSCKTLESDLSKVKDLKTSI